MSEKAFAWHLLVVFPYLTVTTFFALKYAVEHWH